MERLRSCALPLSGSPASVVRIRTCEVPGVVPCIDPTGVDAHGVTVALPRRAPTAGRHVVLASCGARCDDQRKHEAKSEHGPDRVYSFPDGQSNMRLLQQRGHGAHLENEKEPGYAATCARNQRSIMACDIAPLWRATSRPPRNRIMVGIDWIPKRAAVCRAVSVSTFANNAAPAFALAAASNCGAIVRHGPHQAAQKSTTTGSSEASTYLMNEPSSSAAGCSPNRRSLQRPQVGLSCSRPVAIRLRARQDPHGT